METIEIIDNKIKISLFLNHNKIYYVSNYGGDIDINKYIKLLFKDNCYTFFNASGNYTVLSRNGGSGIESRDKYFKFRNVIIISSLSALLLLNLYTTLKNEIINVSEYFVYNFDEFDIKYFKDKIFSSPYLSIEEKEYLYNEDFLNDILPMINLNNHLKMQFEKRFSDIRIESFDKSYEDYDNKLGYYTTDFPNTLYLRDYNLLSDDKNMDTLAHEFIHLCQENYGYNLIIEACAEIISNEYFKDTYISSYSSQVKLLKILMEIIGSYPIWYYNFTGDFSLIEESVKPYLTDSEYITFLNCLSFDYSDNANTIRKCEELKKLLSILYTNIYSGDILDDSAIYRIIIGDDTLIRSYFNNRREESYYLDYENSEYEVIDLDTAMHYNMICISCSKKTEVDYETAMKNKFSTSNGIYRIIDYKSNDINIMRSSYCSSKLTITATIDGVKYVDADADELVGEGIINITYYITDFKLLTADEYINHEYDDDCQIYITKLKDVVINDDYSVYGKVPRKVMLPSVFEKSNVKTRSKSMSIQNLKKHDNF